jgi:hypothetical protein
MKTYVCDFDVHYEREPPARPRGSIVGKKDGDRAESVVRSSLLPKQEGQVGASAHYGHV